MILVLAIIAYAAILIFIFSLAFGVWGLYIAAFIIGVSFMILSML